MWALADILQGFSGAGRPREHPRYRAALRLRYWRHPYEKTNGLSRGSFTTDSSELHGACEVWHFIRALEPTPRAIAERRGSARTLGGGEETP